MNGQSPLTSRTWALAALLATLLGSACGGIDADPFAGRPPDAGSASSGAGGVTGGTGGTTVPNGMAGTGGAADAGGAPADAGAGGGGTGAGGSPGAGGTTGSATGRPTRLIVLGDSITACSNVGGKMGADCSARKLFDHLKTSLAPNLAYENQSAGGAVTEDVPARQLDAVKAGPGAALVLIFVGGNNLSKYIFASDAAATNGLASDLPKVLAAWGQIFAFFNDKAQFPDGYRLMMSTQYNPFDDCTAIPYNISQKKFELLRTFNAELAKVAQQNGASLTDQYTPFLGHGHHANVTRCPHFKSGSAGWMGDLIHPNAAGHSNLFEHWKKTVDGLYR